MSVSVAVLSVVLVGLPNPSSVAATVTKPTKPPIQRSNQTNATRVTVVSATKSVVETIPAPTPPSVTVASKPLSARTPVKNWDSIIDTDWPSFEGSITARAQARTIEVYRRPGERDGVLAFIAGRSVAGPVHFLAVGRSGDWVRVAIPLRPNGTVGWVRRSDVLLIENPYRIVIELSTNRLSVYEGSKRLLEAPVASGTGGTPTPTGLFFLKELVPQNPGGSLGPYAFGLSGYSDVLTNFNGGEGAIGIHGTNTPGKLGTSASHGCVRVDNVNITMMAKNLPLGTPVEIVQTLPGAPPDGVRNSTLWAFSSGVSVPAGNAATLVEPSVATVPTSSTVPTVPASSTVPTVPASSTVPTSAGQ